jgi:2-succinyl-6-hydroxy-2,4-cyclohexadiene-1-carboxylate synthase
MKLHCLPGFLGLASDWNFLDSHFEEVKKYEVVNLEPKRLGGFAGWVGNFLEEAGAPDPAKKEVLVGYSLGGRLALHALQANPSRFDGAVIISSNLGMPEGSGSRPARFEQDQKLAKRFESDPWELLLEDWNSNPLFGGCSVKREEKNFKRAGLANALRSYSLGAQADFRPLLKDFKMPLLWVAGGKDSFYAEMANQASQLSDRGSLWISHSSSHRVPWQDPEGLIKAILEMERNL